jgi:hypothetical protein
MEIDEPEKPPMDHVAMTFEQLPDGWKATAQTEVGSSANLNHAASAPAWRHAA